MPECEIPWHKWAGGHQTRGSLFKQGTGRGGREAGQSNNPVCEAYCWQAQANQWEGQKTESRPIPKLFFKFLFVCFLMWTIFNVFYWICYNIYIYIFPSGHKPYGILVPWRGIEPISPAQEDKSINHWTTREALITKFLRSKLEMKRNPHS